MQHRLHSSGAEVHKPNMKVFQKGEALTYEVSYMGIALGAITTKVVSVDSSASGTRIRTEGYIRSYKGVPFVDLKTTYKSAVDRHCSSIAFHSKELFEDTTYKYIDYNYSKDRDTLIVIERLGKDTLKYKTDTLSLDGKRWQDGLSLLFYARAHAHQQYRDTVPVLMYKTKAEAIIEFGSDKEEVDIDAVDYDIDAVKLEGVSKFTGIFGLTGDFEGWFSRDKYAVPLTAKMHVIIGSVRLELVAWKKPGWNPPKQ